MLFNTLIIILGFFFVNGCTPSQLNNISTPVTVPDHRYETERLSILPPTGNGWENINYKTVGSIDFYSYKNNIRNMHVGIDPFPYRISANSFDQLLEKELSNARRDKEMVERGAFLYSHYFNVQVVEKAGMSCIKREIFEGATSVRGNTLIVNYFCKQPNQPEDFPLIEVVFSDSAVSGLELSNPDTVLAPIWNSLQFKFVDQATSAAYQNWKVKNAEFREFHRKQEEQKRLKNAQKP